MPKTFFGRNSAAHGLIYFRWRTECCNSGGECACCLSHWRCSC